MANRIYRMSHLQKTAVGGRKRGHDFALVDPESGEVINTYTSMWAARSDMRFHPDAIVCIWNTPTRSYVDVYEHPMYNTVYDESGTSPADPSKPHLRSDGTSDYVPSREFIPKK